MLLDLTESPIKLFASNEFAPLPEQEWRKLMIESLRPFLPIFRLLEKNKIPWAITGAFTGVIEGLRIPTKDIDIVVPRERIAEVNDLLQKHGFLQEKENGLPPFSYDPAGQPNERHRKFSSAACGTLQAPNSDGMYRAIGDIVADYAVQIGDEDTETIIVAGISNSGELIENEYAELLGQEKLRTPARKRVPIEVGNQKQELEIPYIPFKHHLLKYLLSDKEGYQEYARVITQMA